MKLTKAQKDFEKKFKGKKIVNTSLLHRFEGVKFVKWVDYHNELFEGSDGLTHFITYEWILLKDLKKWQKEQETKKQITEFWSNMPKWANWVAKASSAWIWYADKPEYFKNPIGWYGTQTNHGGVIPVEYWPKWYKGSIKNSLMERPKEMK